MSKPASTVSKVALGTSALVALIQALATIVHIFK